MRKIIFILLLMPTFLRAQSPCFPSRACTNSDLGIMAPLPYPNLATATNLAQAIGPTDTSITLIQNPGFVAPLFVRIETEIISVSSITGSVLTVAARGVGGTTATGHAAGVLVYAKPEKIHFDQMRLEIEGIENYLISTPPNTTAQHVIPVASLPATCSPATGDVVFLTTGQIGVWNCTATNTWTFGGSGGGAGGGFANIQSGNLVVAQYVVTNPLTGASSAFGPCTFTPSGSTTENAYVYSSLSNSNGSVADGLHIKAATNTFSASGSGCTADSPAAGSAPAGASMLYTWHMTSGAFDSAYTSDWRAAATSTSLSCGTGVSCTGGNGVSINTTTVQQFGPVTTVSGASYAVQDSDRNALLVFINAGAVSVSIPQAGGTGQFVSGWKVDMLCSACGGITVTPTTSTINGSATLSIPASVWAQVRSDGANYFAGTTQGATGPTGPTGSVSNSGTLTLNNVIIGNGTTVIKDSGMAAPTGGFSGLDQTNTYGTNAYNDESAATKPHRVPNISGYAGTVDVGDWWYDPAQQAYFLGGQFSASTGGSPARLICSGVLGFSDQLSTDGATYNGNTSVNACPAGVCATTTQSGSGFSHTCTLPANFFVASGKQLRIEVGYQFTSTATQPTLNLGFRLNNSGTRVVVTSNAGQALATTGTFGGGATWVAGVNAGPGASVSLWAEPTGWGVPLGTYAATRQAATVPATVATNASEVLEFFCAYSAANATNNCALTFYNVWEVN